MAPGESMPTKISRWQMCWWPARQAGQVPHHSRGITVTGSPTVPRVDAWSDLGDASGHLVAENGGQGDALIHVSVQDVQVGPADAGEGHVDPDLSRSWGPLSHGGDVDGVITDVAGGCGHGRHDFSWVAHTRPSGNW